MADHFYIGGLSRRTGVPAQTIRYYEQLGLLPEPPRTESSYRLYSTEHEERLRFIQQAKMFQLSLDEVKSIIDLKEQGERPCEHVVDLIARRLADLDRRIAEMIRFRDSLAERYEWMKSAATGECDGTVCGLIEREGFNAEVGS